MRDMGADVDQSDVLVASVGGERGGDQAKDLLRGVRFHVHNRRLQPGGLRDGNPVLDFFLAGGGDQDFDFVDVVRRRTQNLEVKVDLVQRKRNILVGLGLDGQFEFFFLLPGGDDDFLGNDHGRGERHGHETVATAHALPCPLQRVADLVEVGDIAVGNRVAGQGLDGVTLEAIGALAGLRQFHQLERSRCNIDPDQRWGLSLQEIENSGHVLGKRCHVSPDADNLH